MSSDTKLTPNVRKLIFHKMSLDAIPKGGGFADGIKFLSDREGMAKSLRAADDWVKAAILAVRNAGEPNPWRDKTDEDIAGELMRKIEERKIEQRFQGRAAR
jgi:hypothetical protein